MNNTFDQLKQSANESGESLDLWLEECNASMDPTAIPNMPHIQELLGGNKKELKKLEDYNRIRIIKKKVSEGLELTNDEYYFILKGGLFAAKLVEQIEGDFAFGSGSKITKRVIIDGVAYLVMYFERASGVFEKPFGYMKERSEWDEKIINTLCGRTTLDFLSRL